MSPEQKGPRFGVSTATCIEQTNPRHLLSLQEVSDTFLLCQLLQDMGMEVNYRKWGEKKINQGLKSSDLVLTIHAPIMPSLPKAFVQGWQEEGGFLGRPKGAALWSLSSTLLFGCLKGEFEGALKLAQELAVQRIIVHPRGALFLQEKGYLKPIKERPNQKPIEICVENDRRRKGRNGPWVWYPGKVRELARDLGLPIALDISHLNISLNNFELRNAYETLNDGGANRVKVIHLNAAIPNEEKGIPDLADRGLPIIADDRAKGAIRELYQQLVNDRADVILVFEYFKRHGKTLEEKYRILDQSREALVGKAATSR